LIEYIAYPHFPEDASEKHVLRDIEPLIFTVTFINQAGYGDYQRFSLISDDLHMGPVSYASCDELDLAFPRMSKSSFSGLSVVILKREAITFC
jgi:hypothetical protein